MNRLLNNKISKTLAIILILTVSYYTCDFKESLAQIPDPEATGQRSGSRTELQWWQFAVGIIIGLVSLGATVYYANRSPRVQIDVTAIADAASQPNSGQSEQMSVTATAEKTGSKGSYAKITATTTDLGNGQGDVDVLPTTTPKPGGNAKTHYIGKVNGKIVRSGLAANVQNSLIWSAKGTANFSDRINLYSLYSEGGTVSADVFLQTSLADPYDSIYIAGFTIAVDSVTGYISIASVRGDMSSSDLIVDTAGYGVNINPRQYSVTFSVDVDSFDYSEAAVVDVESALPEGNGNDPHLPVPSITFWWGILLTLLLVSVTIYYMRRTRPLSSSTI